jgi:hypothetical protein
MSAVFNINPLNFYDGTPSKYSATHNEYRPFSRTTFSFRLWQLYDIVVRAPDSRPRCPRFESRAWRIFHDLGKVSEYYIDDGAGRRKGALAVYTPPGWACTAECCVCNIRAPLTITNSTWASGVQTGYLEPQRALWTMSNRQVPPLVNNNNSFRLDIPLIGWEECRWSTLASHSQSNKIWNYITKPKV